MRLRYIWTSCSEVTRRELRASWSCGTVASTSCRLRGTPEGGAAETGHARMATARNTKVARFMGSSFGSEASMIRRGRGGSQEETGSDQTPAASRGSLPGMSRVCCPILAVILLAGFTADSSPAPPSPSPAPCAAPEYRQFDFWLGDWNVYNPAGALVGTNRVTREFDGCVLQEHWVAAGTSPQ